MDILEAPRRVLGSMKSKRTNRTHFIVAALLTEPGKWGKTGALGNPYRFPASKISNVHAKKCSWHGEGKDKGGASNTAVRKEWTKEATGRR